MPSHYTYLIASLPMLHFQVKPLINTQGFLNSCRDLIPDDEFNILDGLLNKRDLSQVEQVTLRRWISFDRSLRNELVKLRAGRQKKDPSKFLKEDDGYWDPSVVHAAMSAFKGISLLESEKILDLERWRYLDELCFGHYFDFDFLIIYALKLNILERWEKIKSANKEILLEGALN